MVVSFFSYGKFLICLNVLNQCLLLLYMLWCHILYKKRRQIHVILLFYFTLFYCMFIDFKMTHVRTNIDNKQKMESFKKFCWLIKSFGNSSSHPTLHHQILWTESFASIMIGKINSIELNIELTMLNRPLLI